MAKDNIIQYKNAEINLEKELIKIGKITLNAAEANLISEAYERMTTANYLKDTYGFNDGDAWSYADDVRELMADYPDLTEEMAIDEVLPDDEDDDE